MCCRLGLWALLSIVYFLVWTQGLSPATTAPVSAHSRKARKRHHLGQAGTIRASHGYSVPDAQQLPRQRGVLQSAARRQLRALNKLSSEVRPAVQAHGTRHTWHKVFKPINLHQQASSRPVTGARAMHSWPWIAGAERYMPTGVFQRRLLQQGIISKPWASLTRLSSSATAGARFLFGSSGAADGSDASATGSSTRSTLLTGMGATGHGSPMGKTIERGPPDSCLGSQYKLAQLEVMLHWIRVDYTELCERVSLAIARQLQLKDLQGNIDVSRVETYLWDTHTATDYFGGIRLEVYVWLAGTDCEVSRHMWLQSLEQQPSRLFPEDPDLQELIQDVTARYSDPGVYIKNRIENSNNMVISVSVGSQVLNSSTTDGTDNDVSNDIGIYDWFFTSESATPTKVDGMLVMGIISGSLLMVFILVVLLQRHLHHRATRQAAAAATTAALAVLTAEPAAGSAISMPRTVQPAAQARTDSAAGTSNSAHSSGGSDHEQQQSTWHHGL